MVLKGLAHDREGMEYSVHKDTSLDLLQDSCRVRYCNLSLIMLNSLFSKQRIEKSC